MRCRKGRAFRPGAVAEGPWNKKKVAVGHATKAMEKDSGRLFVNEQSHSAAGMGGRKAAPPSMCDSVQTDYANVSYS